MPRLNTIQTAAAPNQATVSATYVVSTGANAVAGLGTKVTTGSVAASAAGRFSVTNRHVTLTAAKRTAAEAASKRAAVNAGVQVAASKPV